MNDYLKLAWRNIWRNKRRTVITAGSIFFAVFFSLLMRSFQLGSYSHWINNLVESYTGHLQIQFQGYWEDKTIDNSFEWNPQLDSIINQSENVISAVPRLEYGALASNYDLTKLAIVIGTDPELEDQMSGLSHKLVRYRLSNEFFEALDQTEMDQLNKDKLKVLMNYAYSSEEKFNYEVKNVIGNSDGSKWLDTIKKLSSVSNSYFNNQDGVLIAEKLAQFLKLNLGDTIVLTGAGYHGITAAAKFKILGIITIPEPELNRSLIYLPLSLAQDFYSAPGRLTSLSVNLKNRSFNEILKTKEDLLINLPNNYVVKDWKQLNEFILRQIAADNQGGIVMLSLLYLIVGFGIFGTVLMMTTERRREFGVMVAIGMKKIKLGTMVIIEMIFLGILGLISGIIGALPIIIYFHFNPVHLTGEMAASVEIYGIEPVMPFSLEPGFFINQTLIIVLIVIAASIYPVWSVVGIKVNKALRA